MINDGEYTGEGTFTDGEAWEWTAWTSRSEDSSGHYVISEDERIGDSIVASKVGYTPDDEQEWTLDEELTWVSEADWQAGIDSI